MVQEYAPAAAVIRDDPEVLQMWREAMTNEPHKHNGDSNNITIKPERGTGRAYTLDRLKRHAARELSTVDSWTVQLQVLAVGSTWQSWRVPSKYRPIIGQYFDLTALYLIGKLYRDSKKPHGGDHQAEQVDNVSTWKSARTAEKIAESQVRENAP